MKRKDRRAGILIVLGLCCLPVCALAIIGNLVFGFWIPAPSNATIEHAIRYAPGNGGAGVGDDGRIYDIIAITRPYRTAVSDPKMWVWLRVREDDTVIQEGLLKLALFGGDWRHVVLMEFIPRTAMSPRFLEATFTAQQQARIDTLRSP